MESRFGWIGETRREAMRMLVSEAARQWCRNWSVAQGQDGPDVQLISRHPRSAEEKEVWVDMDDASVRMVPDGMELEQVAADLVGVKLRSGDVFAQDVAISALQDLGRAILGDGRADEMQMDVPTKDRTERSSDSSWGALWFRISLFGHGVIVVVNRPAVDRRVPPKKVVSKSLCSRNQGIEGAQVTLEVVLPLGKTSLGEISGLSEGDVLIADRELEETVDVRIGTSGKVIAQAHLARRGRQRAIAMKGQSQGVED